MICLLNNKHFQSCGLRSQQDFLVLDNSLFFAIMKVREKRKEIPLICALSVEPGRKVRDIGKY